MTLFNGSFALDFFESLGSNSSRQKVLQVIVINDLADIRALVFGKVRFDSIGVRRISSYELRDIAILRLDSLSDPSSNGLAITTKASAHSLKVVDISIEHVSFLPVVFYKFFLRIFLDVTVIDRVEMTSLFFS